MTAEINTFDQTFISRRRAWALLGVLAAFFVMWSACSILLPHDRYIRYQQLTDSDLFRSRWVYERIHYDRTPIDVAIIGSSRVEAGISAPLLEQELSLKLGRAIHVANLAIPDEGRNLHYLVARELLESHPETRLILVSVVERANVSHPAFRYLGDVSDVLQAPLLVNHFYFVDAAFLPYRQMSYFVQTRLPAWFGESRSFRRDYMGTAFDTTYSFHLPSGRLIDRYRIPPREELVTWSREMIASLGGEWRQASPWDALNNPLEADYSKRLIEVAKRHCVETIFVHLPFYNSPAGIYDEAFYRRLGPLLDAQQFSGNPGYFGDGAHLNRYGVLQVSLWLGNVIDPYLRPLLSPDPTGPSKKDETPSAYALRQATRDQPNSEPHER